MNILKAKNFQKSFNFSIQPMVCNHIYMVILLIACIFLGCNNNKPTSQNVPSTATPDRESPGSYQQMDYGPIIAESIQMNRPKKSLVRKGLAIRLAHNIAMIFDTDLVGFAAGVEGGWLDISETDYASYKGSSIAKIKGRQIFENSDQLAGWAKDGSFDAHRQANGMGNLPAKWAHYNGYYKYGDKVLLSYTVGGTDVRELPAAVKYKGMLAFTRTMQIAATDKSIDALILNKRDSWSVKRATAREIIFDTGPSALAVCLANAPEGVKLKVNKGGLVSLYVPPSNRSKIIRVGILKLHSTDDGPFQKFSAYLGRTQFPNLKTIMQGGPSQWNKTIKTPGVFSNKDSGYVLDHIPVPFKNPWGSWMRLSGIDFFDEGKRAAITTWNGDVWIVSGIDESLKNVKWHRFASGLFYPMGVAVVNGAIYVTERSQLTRLRDYNGDGEADYYENFNNDGIVYPRALTQGLAVDSDGYFYFLKNGNRVPSDIPEHGALIRVSPNGAKREVYGHGFRSANTLGVGPGNTIFTVDQQGRWVPVDRISVVKTKGGFYGYRPHGGESLPVGEFQVPVAWVPHTIDNSAGFITYVGDSRWGPLSGHWIMSSYGQGTLFEVLMEKMGNKLQGGVVKLRGIKSQSGVMRASVNPADGQLYMVGLRGWGSIATADGSFSRIRYAGGEISLPKALQVTPRGVKITFMNLLNPTDATNIENYQVERWEYLYSKHYGSPEMSLSHPEQRGHDSLTVSSVTISDNGQTVLLKIPDMQSVMQMKIAFNLKFKNGGKAKNTIYHTVNWLSAAEANNKPAWQQRILSGRRDSFKTSQTFIPGRRLISENECRSCHAVSGESFGPSFQNIAQRYSGNKKVIDQLSKKVIHGGSGKWGKRVMPPHPTITKPDVEKMVKYILSISKKNSSQ